jgi:hypothetical protein
MNPIERFEGVLLPAYTLVVLSLGCAVGVAVGAWVW